MWVFALVAAILIVQGIVWMLIFLWMRRKRTKLSGEMCQSPAGKVVLGPVSALYRGADAVYGNVKGNGVICLYENALVFEKLVGRRIRIERADITSVSVEKWFKGKSCWGAGGRHLVVIMKDGNRVGFLLRNAELWAREISPLKRDEPDRT